MIKSILVLVVDDLSLNLMLLEDILIRKGFRVITEIDPQRAWESCQEKIDEIGLIITDLHMPGMNGAELSRKILSLNPEKPIILATTASDHELDELGARTVNFRSIIGKPYCPFTLDEVCRNALAN